jgi:hypothetical protein
MLGGSLTPTSSQVQASMNSQRRVAIFIHEIVGVGSEAEVQRRVQSGGSMADEAIERIYSRNVLLGSANVKRPIESGNNEVL